MAASRARKARAISRTPKPPTVLRVRAMRPSLGMFGWQAIKIMLSSSSSAGPGDASPETERERTSSSDFDRSEDSRRSRSSARFFATCTSHPDGFSGTPLNGHTCKALSSASWTTSSARSRCRGPNILVRVETICPA
jgi:hypothetical protein